MQPKQKPDYQSDMEMGKVVTMPGVETPFVASIRTGLAGRDEALMNRIPKDYENKTVGEVVNYLLGGNIADNQLSLAESVRRELEAKGTVVVVNGKRAELTDLARGYVSDKTHKLPDGSQRTYRGLDIEVSAVQQGGYF